ncbi:MAG TPA: DUF4293 domain-containing protein [Bacteroidales bacterium]|nr:DUF4293 domain-containing protein [Bacteroidales bacterium]HPS17904.1 DUF4293 domain-containing protein [Bacteroidales bacterium]
MIQRIQTLCLLIALGTISACFFLPFWEYQGSDYLYEVNVFAVKFISGNPQILYVSTIPILIILAVSGLITIAAIFYFKNRQMQMKINNFNIFLTIIFSGTVFLWIPYMINQQIPTAVASWKYGLILPLITLFSLIFANQFIKKDEKLVKSADRLR